MNQRIIDRGHELFVDPGACKFNGLTKRWRFGLDASSGFLQLGTSVSMVSSPAISIDSPVIPSGQSSVARAT